jgi:LAO/AO transport system kinase
LERRRSSSSWTRRSAACSPARERGRPSLAARRGARGACALNGRRDWTRELLVEAVRAGDQRALARAITLIENGAPLAYEVVHDLYPETGRAFSVGVTGPPGVGKSSLVSALIRHVRAKGQTVGVISVDPSSPFTEGALLGDRIRLTDHFLDPGVFIRSMGTRGHQGGLAETTLQVALVLDAAGKDTIFLETVGTGQSEVGVLAIADTVVLALMPGSGDSIQALKAGIMEIPDVIVINKMDHPLAKTMLSEVRQVLSLGPRDGWRPPIVLTEAVRGDGVGELWAAIDGHRQWLAADGELERRRRRNLAAEVFDVAANRARRHLEETVRDDPELLRLLDEVQTRALDPLTAVRAILERVFRIGNDDETLPG